MAVADRPGGIRAMPGAPSSSSALADVGYRVKKKMEKKKETKTTIIIHNVKGTRVLPSKIYRYSYCFSYLFLYACLICFPCAHCENVIS